MQGQTCEERSEGEAVKPENLTIRRDGDKLILEIDLSAPGYPSATGKSQIIATSHGNVPVPGPESILLGLNCFRMVRKERL